MLLLRVLQKASPVLDAMLCGSLVEARRKTIEVKESWRTV